MSINRSQKLGINISGIMLAAGFILIALGIHTFSFAMFATCMVLSLLVNLCNAYISLFVKPLDDSDSCSIGKDVKTIPNKSN